MQPRLSRITNIIFLALRIILMICKQTCLAENRIRVLVGEGGCDGHFRVSFQFLQVKGVVVVVVVVAAVVE
jgi:hypothetical protein